MITRSKIVSTLFTLTLVALSGCETSTQIAKATTNFSTENVLKVREGMLEEEIVALFGYPDSVRSMTCSLRNKCKAWEYEQDRPRVRAMFVFENVGNSWVIDDFDIRRD